MPMLRPPSTASRSTSLLLARKGPLTATITFSARPLELGNPHADRGLGDTQAPRGLRVAAGLRQHRQQVQVGKHRRGQSWH